MDALNLMYFVILPLLGALLFVIEWKAKNYWVLTLCIPFVNFLIFSGALGYTILCGPFLLRDYIKYGTINKNEIRSIVRGKSNE